MCCSSSSYKYYYYCCYCYSDSFLIRSVVIQFCHIQVKIFNHIHFLLIEYQLNQHVYKTHDPFFISLRLSYSKFRLSYYPHQLKSFMELLKAAFFGKCKQNVFGDFKHFTPGQGEAPCYFIHVVEKTA